MIQVCKVNEGFIDASNPPINQCKCLPHNHFLPFIVRNFRSSLMAYCQNKDFIVLNSLDLFVRFILIQEIDNKIQKAIAHYLLNKDAKEKINKCFSSLFVAYTWRKDLEKKCPAIIYTDSMWNTLSCLMEWLIRL